MPSTIWSGAISFGLVSIPIKVSRASESHSIGFRQIHLDDGGRVRTRKICELDGRELRQDEIGKGYELPDGNTVEVTDDELAGMPLPTAKAVEIVAFVPADSIDPIRISDSYYLAAGAVAAKPYTLLRRALERSSKVAIAKFALRGRERLGLLAVRDQVMVLHTLRWPDEIRSPESLAPKPVGIDAAEIGRAVQLLEAMAADGISAYRDTYQDALEQVIEAKTAGREPPQAEAAEAPTGQLMDLMAALEQSVQKAKQSRGEDGQDEGATVHDMPEKTAKKTTKAKKAPAKKTDAKKSPGRHPRTA
ncbi:Ku protein [Streptomyces sp. NPDC088341]|uniref:non-homologous end joining protein Ku n=1 Tax=Streptomyces sp. NPDC088341 TaxID=3154870 RepID=UPI00343B20A2